MEIRISEIQTLDEIKAAYKLYHDKYAKWTQHIGWLLLAGGLILFLIKTNEAELTAKLVIAFLLSGIGLLLIWNRYNAPHKALKKFSQKDNRGTLIISNDGLSYEGQDVDAKIRWAHFTDAIVTEEMVLLMNPSGSFYIFPKRFFSQVEYDFLKEKANPISRSLKEINRRKQLKAIVGQ